jgi:alkylated DNA repair dioxygenase AlkB
VAPPILDIRHHEHALADADADAVLEFLLADVTWDERMRARKTASFGVPYNYSGQHYDAVPMPPPIAQIADRARAHAGHSFNNCLANLYESGDNTMGFHQDSYEGLTHGSSIAIFSLGAPRRLVFRSLDRAHHAKLTLEHGSLLLMTHVTQRGWAHAVPRDPAVGCRVSLTFRSFSPSAGSQAAPPR